MDQNNFRDNEEICCTIKENNDDPTLQKDKLKDFLASLQGLSSKELTINSLDFMINTIEETTTQIETMPKYSCNILDPKTNYQYNSFISRRLSNDERNSIQKDFTEQSNNRIKNYKTIINSLKIGLVDESSKYPDPIPLYKTIIYNKPEISTQDNYVTGSVNYNGSGRKRTPKKKSNLQLSKSKEEAPSVKTVNKNNISNDVPKECNRTYDPSERSNKIKTKNNKRITTFQSSAKKNSNGNQTIKNIKSIDNSIGKISCNQKKAKPYSKSEMISEQLLYNSNPIKFYSQLDKKNELDKYSTPTNVKDFICLSSEKKTSLNTKDTLRKEIPVRIAEGYSGLYENIGKCKANPKIYVEEEEKNTSRLMNDIHIDIDSDKGDLNNDEERQKVIPYPTKHRTSNQRLFTHSPIKNKFMTLGNGSKPTINKIIYHSFDAEGVQGSRQVKYETCCIMGDNCFF